MEFVTLSNGAKMPLIGLGTWLADNEEELAQAIDTALTLGYRHIDTAWIYKNEAVVGKALKKWLDSGKIKREELFIVAKLPFCAMTPTLVDQFMDKTLKNLQLNYVDVYLIHTPFAVLFGTDEKVFSVENGKVVMDTSFTLEQIWNAMEKQVGLGKTRAIGISNFDEDQIQRIVKAAKIQPAVLQTELHSYLQENSLRALCEKHNIKVTSYASLGSPGRKSLYDRVGIKFEPMNLLTDPVVVKIANAQSKTSAQILLRFLVQQKIMVIPKSTSASRLKENLQLLDFQLTPKEMDELKGLDKGSAGRTVLFDFLPGIKDHPQFPKTIRSSLH